MYGLAKYKTTPLKLRTLWKKIILSGAGKPPKILKTEEKLVKFYTLARTPVNEGEEFEAPCKLPDGVEPAPDRKLFPGNRLRSSVQRERAIRVIQDATSLFFRLH